MHCICHDHIYMCQAHVMTSPIRLLFLDTILFDLPWFSFLVNHLCIYRILSHGPGHGSRNTPISIQNALLVLLYLLLLLFLPKQSAVRCPSLLERLWNAENPRNILGLRIPWVWNFASRSSGWAQTCMLKISFVSVEVISDGWQERTTAYQSGFELQRVEGFKKSQVLEVNSRCHGTEHQVYLCFTTSAWSSVLACWSHVCRSATCQASSSICLCSSKRRVLVLWTLGIHNTGGAAAVFSHRPRCMSWANFLTMIISYSLACSCNSSSFFLLISPTLDNEGDST